MSVINTTSSSMLGARLGHSPETLGRSLSRLAAGLKPGIGHGRRPEGPSESSSTGESDPLARQIEASNAGAMLPPIEDVGAAEQATDQVGALLANAAPAEQVFGNLAPGAALRLLQS